MAYKITLNGQGGELDCRTVETEDEISEAVEALARECELAAGDSIIITETDD